MPTYTHSCVKCGRKVQLSADMDKKLFHCRPCLVGTSEKQRQYQAIEGSLMRNLNPEVEPSPSYACIVARVQRLRDELASIADECQKDADSEEHQLDKQKMIAMAYAYEQAADLLDRYFSEFIS